MPRPVRTREGVFLLAGVLAAVGLVLVISGGLISLTIVLFVVSAALLAAGVATEILAFLSPGTGGSGRRRSGGLRADRNPDAPANGEQVDGSG